MTGAEGVRAELREAVDGGASLVAAMRQLHARTDADGQIRVYRLSTVRDEVRDDVETELTLATGYDPSDDDALDWLRTTTDRIMRHFDALLAERDALAEQVADQQRRLSPEMGNNPPEVERQRFVIETLQAAEKKRTAERDEARAALARAEQREARVRETLNLAFLISDSDACGTVAVVRVKQLLAALNEGDTNDQQQ